MHPKSGRPKRTLNQERMMSLCQSAMNVLESYEQIVESIRRAIRNGSKVFSAEQLLIHLDATHPKFEDIARISGEFSHFKDLEGTARRSREYYRKYRAERQVQRQSPNPRGSGDYDFSSYKPQSLPVASEPKTNGESDLDLRFYEPTPIDLTTAEAARVDGFETMTASELNTILREKFPSMLEAMELQGFLTGGYSDETVGAILTVIEKLKSAGFITAHPQVETVFNWSDPE